MPITILTYRFLYLQVKFSLAGDQNAQVGGGGTRLQIASLRGAKELLSLGIGHHFHLEEELALFKVVFLAFGGCHCDSLFYQVVVRYGLFLR